MATSTKRCIVWFRDGKAGHEQQVQGLLAALQRQCDCVVVPCPAGAVQQALAACRPDWVLGAGHATHAGILRLSYKTAARSIVLMRPGMPAGLFDACIIPAYDRQPLTGRIFTSIGPLNPMRPGCPDPAKGLLLLGGPSKHYRWQDGRVESGLQRLFEQLPHVRWTLVGSRRTPVACWQRLAAYCVARGHAVQEWSSCPAGWLQAQLPASGHCWVTADSFSMAFEALSAGCTTGMIQPGAVRSSKAGRVRAVLRQQGVTWYEHADLLAAGRPSVPLAEADRAAAWLLTTLAV